MGTVSEAGQPTFILSCARSGSTLLRYIVDTHPEICSPAEVNLGVLCAALHPTIYDTLALVSSPHDDVERRRLASAHVRQQVDDIMNAYARAKNKSRWCEKSPMNLNHLELLQEIFPDANYICLYRHCLDVMHSCLEFGKLGFIPEIFVHVQSRPDNMVAAMMNYWIERTSRLLAFEETHQANCFRVTFESLVFDTESTMKSLCAFLGVAWHHDLLTRVFSSRHDDGPGDRKIQFCREVEMQAVGKGATIARPPLPRDLTDRMNDLLQRLGYPAVGSQWSSWPPPHWTAPRDARGAQDYGSIDEIFTRHVPKRLGTHAHLPQESMLTYKIAVDGDERTSWMIDLTGSKASLYRGDDRADCTIMVSAGDLMDIVNGRLNAQAAFDQGRLRANRKLTAARALGKLILGA